MTIWGTYNDRNYGPDRKGKPDGLTDNGFIRRYWQNGLEMIAMMLDYHDATRDDAFRGGFQHISPIASVGRSVHVGATTSSGRAAPAPGAGFAPSAA